MERKQQLVEVYRAFLFLMILTAISGLAFAAGLMWSMYGGSAHAAEKSKKGKNVRVVYPKKTDLDFEGASIEGEIRNPGEFYFQRRPQEKMDSLVSRRKDFHREMLRDSVLSK